MKKVLLLLAVLLVLTLSCTAVKEQVSKDEDCSSCEQELIWALEQTASP